MRNHSLTHDCLRSGFIVTTLVLIALLCAGANATEPRRGSLRLNAPLPAYYPAQFPHSGKITEIESQNSIIINGLRYKLSAYVKVHTKESKYATLGALQAGQELGFKTNTRSQANSTRDRGEITEMWVLPTGSVKLH
ncbi:MAG: hypothetical protein OEZ68_19980 [Gammaproteobacteria bacterium]|nr:hypothetical protein [Gammaproteobacteria bacterium]MDH5803088.1 hypothetical protein [Gammaproteobacteria bacterium]